MKYKPFARINRNRYWCNKDTSHVVRQNSVDRDFLYFIVIISILCIFDKYYLK